MLSWQKGKNRIFTKAISLIMAQVFFLSTIAQAAPSSRSLFKNKRPDYKAIQEQRENVLEKKRDALSGKKETKRSPYKQDSSHKINLPALQDLSSIYIPGTLGRVTEVYDAKEDRRQKTEVRSQKTEDRLIVLIQDLHTNPEGQLNLASILELLIKDYKLNLVCSEGADGIVDTSSVSSFPDKEVREKVARLFVNSGELTGEEYLSITKYPDLLIWGIEDRDSYFENIIQFNKIMKFSPQAQVFISQAKEALGQLKKKIYSKKLLEIDQRETDYEEQKIETNEYLEYLLDVSGLINQTPTDHDVGARVTAPERNKIPKYKNITLLMESIEMEKQIDQQRIMQESQNLFLNLQSALQAKRNKTEMDSLMVKAQLFKDQKISPFSFYSYLKDLALKHIPDQISKYPGLNDFIDYLTKVNSLDSTKLFIEMEDLAYEVKQSLAKNKEQKDLISALRNIDFLEGFFNLKASNEELDYYLANKDSHKVAFFKSIITRLWESDSHSPNFIDYNPDLIDDHLQELEDFYKTVKERDIAMFTNTANEVDKRNTKVTALIHGGFHTKGITRLLRDNNYSYIVVSPYSSTEIDEENYQFLLSGRRKPITDLLKDFGLPYIVNSLSSYLRIPLAFSEEVIAKFNEIVAPEIARIWGCSVDEVKIELLGERMGFALAGAGQRLERWQNSICEIEVKSPEEGTFVIRVRTEGNIYGKCIEITRDTAKVVKREEGFKGKTVAKSIGTKVKRRTTDTAPQPRNLDGTSGNKRGGSWENALEIILKNPNLIILALQGRLTINEYRKADKKAATLHRNTSVKDFEDLCEQGYLVKARPSRSGRENLYRLRIRLDMPIVNLPLLSRRFAIRRAGIVSVGDLLRAYTDGSLRKIQDVGDLSIKQAEEIFKQYFDDPKNREDYLTSQDKYEDRGLKSASVRTQISCGPITWMAPKMKGKKWQEVSPRLRRIGPEGKTAPKGPSGVIEVVPETQGFWQTEDGKPNYLLFVPLSDRVLIYTRDGLQREELVHNDESSSGPMTDDMSINTFINSAYWHKGFEWFRRELGEQREGEPYARLTIGTLGEGGAVFNTFYLQYISVDTPEEERSAGPSWYPVRRILDEEKNILAEVLWLGHEEFGLILKQGGVTDKGQETFVRLKGSHFYLPEIAYLLQKQGLVKEEFLHRIGYADSTTRYTVEQEAPTEIYDYAQEKWITMPVVEIREVKPAEMAESVSPTSATQPAEVAGLGESKADIHADMRGEGGLSFDISTEYSPVTHLILGTAESFIEGEAINEAMRRYYGTKDAPRIELLAEEYEAMAEILKSYGVEVYQPNPSETVPQQLAPRDIGFVIGDTFVVSSMKWGSRSKEIEAIRDILKQFKGRVIEVPPDIILEGGNIMVDGNRIFVGIGERTSPEAVEFLERNFGDRFEIYPLYLSDREEILHLDAVFNIIGEGYAVIYPEGIENFDEIRELLTGYKLLSVTKEEKDLGACNIFSINGRALLIREGLDRVRDELTKDGFICHDVPWDETKKTGTVGPRCAILPLFRIAKPAELVVAATETAPLQATVARQRLIETTPTVLPYETEMLIEQVPALRSLYEHIRKSHGRNGLIGVGYHRFEHSLEVASVVLQVARGRNLPYERVLELAVATLLHDYDPRPPFTPPLVENTLELLNEDELIGLLSEMDVNIGRIRVLIRGTTFPLGDEFRAEIDRQIADDNLLKEDMELLALADRAATYICLNPQQAEKRLIELVREIKRSEASLIEGTPGFLQQFVVPEIEGLLEYLPDVYRQRWNENLHHFANRGKTVEREASQIGKRTQLVSIEGNTATARDSQGTIRAIDLTLQELDVAGLISQFETMQDVGQIHRQIILTILGLLEKSPPDFYTFSILIEDRFGFAPPQHNLIALYEALANNPIAQFHEICEYLINTGILNLELRDDALIIYIVGKQFGDAIPLTRQDALKIAQKDSTNPHYLLRALQREIFGKRDWELTQEIKHMQQDAIGVKEKLSNALGIPDEEIADIVKAMRALHNGVVEAVEEGRLGVEGEEGYLGYLKDKGASLGLVQDTTVTHIEAKRPKEGTLPLDELVRGQAGKGEELQEGVKPGTSGSLNEGLSLELVQGVAQERYWDAFERELRAYLDTPGPKPQERYARGWLKQLELIPELKSRKFLSSYGLREMSEGKETITLFKGSSLSSYYEVSAPIQAFIDRDLEEERINERPALDWAMLHFKAYQLVYFEMIENYQDYKDIAHFPAPKEPQYIMFVSQEKARELLDDPSFAGWVVSGPIIMVTEVALRNLNNFFSIRDNARHEFKHHVMLQQRLKRGREAMLWLEPQVLEGLDLVSHRQEGRPEEARLAGLYEDMMGVQVNEEVFRRLQKDFPPANKILEGDWDYRWYLFYSLYIQSFFASAYGGQRMDEGFDYSYSDALSGFRMFYHPSSDFDFIRWRREHNWEGHKEWWNKHGRRYVFTALPYLISLEDLAKVCSVDTEGIKGEAKEISFLRPEEIYVRTFLEEIDDYYEGEFGITVSSALPPVRALIDAHRHVSHFTYDDCHAAVMHELSSFKSYFTERGLQPSRDWPYYSFLEIRRHRQVKDAESRQLAAELQLAAESPAFGNKVLDAVNWQRTTPGQGLVVYEPVDEEEPLDPERVEMAMELASWAAGQIAMLNDSLPPDLQTDMNFEVILCNQKLYELRFREKGERRGFNPEPFLVWSKGDMDEINGRMLWCINVDKLPQSITTDNKRWAVHELHHLATWVIIPILHPKENKNALLADWEGIAEADARLLAVLDGRPLQLQEDMNESTEFIALLPPEELTLPANINEKGYDHPSFAGNKVSESPGYASCFLWFLGLMLEIAEQNHAATGDLIADYETGREYFLKAVHNVQAFDIYRTRLQELGVDYDRLSNDRDFLLRVQQRFKQWALGQKLPLGDLTRLLGIGRRAARKDTASHFSLRSIENSRPDGGEPDSDKFIVSGKKEFDVIEGDIEQRIGKELDLLERMSYEGYNFNIRGPDRRRNSRLMQFLRRKLLFLEAIARSQALHDGELNQELTIILADQYDFLAGDHRDNNIIILNASDLEEMLEQDEDERFVSELITSLLSEELAHERGAGKDEEQRLAYGCATNSVYSLTHKPQPVDIGEYIAFVERYGEDFEDEKGYIGYLRKAAARFIIEEAIEKIATLIERGETDEAREALHRLKNLVNVMFPVEQILLQMRRRIVRIIEELEIIETLLVYSPSLSDWQEVLNNLRNSLFLGLDVAGALRSLETPVSLSDILYAASLPETDRQAGLQGVQYTFVNGPHIMSQAEKKAVEITKKLTNKLRIIASVPFVVRVSGHSFKEEDIGLIIDRGMVLYGDVFGYGDTRVTEAKLYIYIGEFNGTHLFLVYSPGKEKVVLSGMHYDEAYKYIKFTDSQDSVKPERTELTTWSHILESQEKGEILGILAAPDEQNEAAYRPKPRLEAIGPELIALVDEIGASFVPNPDSLVDCLNDLVTIGKAEVIHARQLREKSGEEIRTSKDATTATEQKLSATSLFVFARDASWGDYPTQRQALIASLNTEARNHLIWEALNNTLLWKAYQELETSSEALSATTEYPVLPEELRHLTKEQFIKVLDENRERLSRMLAELWPDEATRPNVVLTLGADLAAEYDPGSDTVLIDLRAPPLVQFLALQDEITHAQMEIDDELPSLMDQARLLQERFSEEILTPERIELALQRTRALDLSEEIASLLIPLFPDQTVEQIQDDIKEGDLDIQALSDSIEHAVFSGNGNGITNLIEELLRLSDYPEAERMGLDIRELFLGPVDAAELQFVSLLDDPRELDILVQDAQKRGMDLAGVFNLLFALSYDNPHIARQQYEGWMRHFYPLEGQGTVPEEDIELIQMDYDNPELYDHIQRLNSRPARGKVVLGGKHFTILRMGKYDADSFLEWLDGDREAQETLMFSDGLLVMGCFDNEVVKVIRAIEKRYNQKLILQDIGGKLIPIQIDKGRIRKRTESVVIWFRKHSRVIRNLLLVTTVVAFIVVFLYESLAGVRYIAPSTQHALMPVNPPWTEQIKGYGEMTDENLVVQKEYEFRLFNTSLVPFRLSPFLLNQEGHPDWEGASLYFIIPETPENYGYKVKFIPLGIAPFTFWDAKEYILFQPGTFRVPLPDNAEKYMMIVEAYLPADNGEWGREELKQVASESREVSHYLSIDVRVVGPYKGLAGEGPARFVVKGSELERDVVDKEGKTAVEEFEEVVEEVRTAQTLPGVRVEVSRERDVSPEKQFELNLLRFKGMLSSYSAGADLFEQRIEFLQSQPALSLAVFEEKAALRQAMIERISEYTALLLQGQQLDKQAERLQLEADFLVEQLRDISYGREILELDVTAEDIQGWVDSADVRTGYKDQFPQLDFVLGQPQDVDAGMVYLMLEQLELLKDISSSSVFGQQVAQYIKALQGYRPALAKELHPVLGESAQKQMEQLVQEQPPIIIDEPEGIHPMALDVESGLVALEDLPSREDPETVAQFIYQQLAWFGFTSYATEELLAHVRFLMTDAQVRDQLGQGGGGFYRNGQVVSSVTTGAFLHEVIHHFFDGPAIGRTFGMSFEEFRYAFYAEMLEAASHRGEENYGYPKAAELSYNVLFSTPDIVANSYTDGIAKDMVGYGGDHPGFVRVMLSPSDSLDVNLEKIIAADKEGLIDFAHFPTSMLPLLLNGQVPENLKKFSAPYMTGQSPGESWVAGLSALDREQLMREGSYLNQALIQVFAPENLAVEPIPEEPKPIIALKDTRALEEAQTQVQAAVDIAREISKTAVEDTLFLEMVRMNGGGWLDSYVRHISPEERAGLGPRLEALGNVSDVAEIWMQTNGDAIRLLMHSTMPPGIRTLVQQQVPPVKLLWALGLLPGPATQLTHAMPQTADGLWEWLDKLEHEGAIRGEDVNIIMQTWLNKLDILIIWPDIYDKYNSELIDAVYEVIAWMSVYYPAQTAAILEQTNISALALLARNAEVAIELIRSHPRPFAIFLFESIGYALNPWNMMGLIINKDPALAAEFFRELDGFEAPVDAHWTLEEVQYLVIGKVFASHKENDAIFLHELLQLEDGREWLLDLLTDDTMFMEIREYTGASRSPEELERTAATLINSLETQADRDGLAEVFNAALDAWGQPALTRQDDGQWVTETGYGAQAERLVIAAPVVFHHSKPIINVRYSEDGIILAEDNDGEILRFDRVPGGWDAVPRQSGEPKDRGITDFHSGPSTSPDDRYMVYVTMGGSAGVFHREQDDGPLGKAIVTLHEEQANWVKGVSFSPDGKEFALALDIEAADGEHKGVIEIYQVDELLGQQLTRLTETKYVYKDSFSLEIFDLTNLVLSPRSESLRIFDEDAFCVVDTMVWGTKFNVILASTSSAFAPKWGGPSNPLNQTLAVGTKDGLIYMFIPEEGIKVDAHKILKDVHSKPVTSIVFSHGGNLCASGDSEGNVVIHQYNRSNDDWELLDERRPHFVSLPISDLAFSPDDEILFVTVSEYVESYFFQDKSWRVEDHFLGAVDQMLSPDGSTLAIVYSDGRFEIKYRKPDGDWQRIFYKEHFGNIVDASFSSDSQNLAVINQNDRVIVLNWDKAGPWEKIQEFTHPGASQVAFSDNGEQLFIGAMPEEGDVPIVSIYELQVQALLVSTELGLPTSNFTITYTEDGKNFMATDNTTGTKYVYAKEQGAWRSPRKYGPTETPEIGPELEPLQIPTFFYPPDSDRMFSVVRKVKGLNESLIIMQSTSDTPWEIMIEPKEDELIIDVAFSPDGTEVAVGVVFLDEQGEIIDGRGEIRIYPLEQFRKEEEKTKVRLSYQKDRSILYLRDIRDVAYSSDGDLLATASERGLTFYDRDEGWKPRYDKFPPSFAGVGDDAFEEGDFLDPVQVAISTDGQVIAAADSKGDLAFIDSGGGKASSTGIKLSVTTMEFSPTEKMLAVGRENGAVELRRPYQVWPAFEAFEASTPVTAIAFLPDGQRMAVARWGSLAIYKQDEDGVWDTIGMDLPLPKEARLISHLKFSPDGHTLITGGDMLLLYEEQEDGSRFSPTELNVFDVSGIGVLSNQEFVVEGLCLDFQRPDLGYIPTLLRFCLGSDGSWKAEILMEFDSPSLKTVFQEGAGEFARVVESSETGQPVLEIYSRISQTEVGTEIEIELKGTVEIEDIESEEEKLEEQPKQTSMLFGASEIGGLAVVGGATRAKESDLDDDPDRGQPDVSSGDGTGKIDLNTFDTDQEKMAHTFVLLGYNVLKNPGEFMDEINKQRSLLYRIVIIAGTQTEADDLRSKGFTDDIVDILIAMEGHLKDFSIVRINAGVYAAAEINGTEFGATLDKVFKLDHDLAEAILSGV